MIAITLTTIIRDISLGTFWGMAVVEIAFLCHPRGCFTGCFFPQVLECIMEPEEMTLRRRYGDGETAVGFRATEWSNTVDHERHQWLMSIHSKDYVYSRGSIRPFQGEVRRQRKREKKSSRSLKGIWGSIWGCKDIFMISCTSPQRNKPYLLCCFYLKSISVSSSCCSKKAALVRQF